MYLVRIRANGQLQTDPQIRHGEPIEHAEVLAPSTTGAQAPHRKIELPDG